MAEKLKFIPLSPEYDTALASIIRDRLKEHHLDIPGTAYFDRELDHLSSFYARPGRAYFVLLRGSEVLGGIGLAEFTGLPACCELQKLYLKKEAEGSGLGYRMIERIEEQARSMGYRRIYLETHTNLPAAIHEYEASGYTLIDPPANVVHSTMNRFFLKELFKNK